MYCIVENPKPINGMPRYMIVLHDKSVATSGYNLLVFGLTGMQQAQMFKRLLGLERKELL